MTAKSCGCDFATKHPTEHDFLLGIEDMDPVKAATYIAVVIGNDDRCALISYPGDEMATPREMLDDPSDFARFVGQHNWRDPVGMYDLAATVSYAAEQALSGRHGQKIRAALTEVSEGVA